jgi:hypothetical protein
MTKAEQVEVTTTTVGAIANVRATQRAISADKAAKEVRGILRANFDVVTAIDPSILDVKVAHNDGNRWPAMHADVERYVTDRAFRAEMNATHRMSEN